MKEKLLICTFSGGRTSAFMAQFLQSYCKYDDYDKLFIYANTGKELPETLDFINLCDKKWNLNILWVEAKINKEKGRGTDFKIVNYDTASRNGEPFAEMLTAYPMPHNTASNCTRELKEVPIRKYAKSLGYKKIYKAMGIRFDERHRISNTAEKQNIIYPLINDIKVDSKFIRYWWDSQDFDLQLKDYQGNCDLCFKKSQRKRLTLIKENPSIAEWWQKMEEKHSTDVSPWWDMRDCISIAELIEKAKRPFKTVNDKHELMKQNINLFEPDMDIETDCFCKAS
jgi:3'-phosphoadenosine 5'-phosphosulfate sulfotransferase (PAPS reductase)/FAD synthetase